jgi:hypothetical protein
MPEVGALFVRVFFMSEPKSFHERCEIALLQVAIIMDERLEGGLTPLSALHRIRAIVRPLATEALERAGLGRKGPDQK